MLLNLDNVQHGKIIDGTSFSVVHIRQCQLITTQEALLLYGNHQQ